MKKIITLLLVLLTLCACGQKSDDQGSNPVNPHGYEIVAIEAGQLPLTLPDVDAAVINGN